MTRVKHHATIYPAKNDNRHLFWPRALQKPALGAMHILARAPDVMHTLADRMEPFGLTNAQSPTPKLDCELACERGGVGAV